MRILFAGSPAFAVPSLERLLARHEIALVLSQPARPAGRGRKVEPTAVARAAQERGLVVETPEKPNDPEFLDRLAGLALDMGVVVSYGRILSKRFLAIPRLGCFNLHGSILPEYRGASPVQAALADGRTETGLTVFRIVPRLDAGPIVATVRTAIGPDETAGALLVRLSVVGADLVADAVEAICAGTSIETAQDESRATSTRILVKEDGAVDWTRPAALVRDHWRAMTPWPGAFTWHHAAAGGDPRRLLLARVVVAPGDRARVARPGIVVSAGDEGIDVETGGGLLRILEVQPEGKRAMPVGEFLRGTRIAPGDRLGPKEE